MDLESLYGLGGVVSPAPGMVVVSGGDGCLCLS